MAPVEFAAAINCIDGRTQLPVIEYLRDRFGANHIDLITEPGVNKILAQNKDRKSVQSVRERLIVSVKNHGTTQVAIVGHHNCAGNPVAEETQKRQISRAISRVEAWRLRLEVIGLWVDEHWQVTEVRRQFS